MKFEAVNKCLKHASDAIAKNSPTILTTMGVAGLVTTVVMTHKATIKAMDIMYDEAQDYDEPFTKKDVFLATWKCYIPAASMGLVTAACIIGANSISAKRTAAIASLYSISEATLKEYQGKVIDTIGANKEGKLRDEIAQGRLDKNPASKSEVVLTGSGDMLCYDVLSGRYFRSDIEKIRQVQNSFNHSLISDIWLSVNDLYYELGLDGIKLGDNVGWNVDQMLEVDFRSRLTDDGKPCLVLDYAVEPKYEYKDR